MNTTHTDWAQAVVALRRYKPHGRDIEDDTRAAKREARAKARCRLHLLCYVALGLIILAWVTGARDWIVNQFVSFPAAAIVAAAATWGLLMLLSPLLRSASHEEIETSIRIRYQRAAQERLLAVAPMLNASPDVREIVQTWMHALPALRNREMDELDKLFVLWRWRHPGEAVDETKDALKGYVADGT